MKNKRTLDRTETLLPTEVSRFMLVGALNVLDVTTVESIVCELNGIDTSLLFKKTRLRSIVFTRQLIMYFLSCSVNYTYQFIAGRYEKTHATVVHSKNTVQNLICFDKEINRKVSYAAHKIILKAS